MAQENPGPLALIGFGEAGRYVASSLRAASYAGRVSGYDIKTKQPGQVASAMRLAFRDFGVNGLDDLSAALHGAGIILSLVTADQALSAAKTAATCGGLGQGALYIDGNSCAPETKRRAADLIEAAGGRYVDMAIMAPVGGAIGRLPLLVAGPHADTARAALLTLGMTAIASGSEVGRASTIKMLRSVMIKGLEALMLESLLAAEKSGVTDEVIASLDASFPGHDWRARATYSFERVTTHGLRRSEEMREVATTLQDLALPSGMSEATVNWQAQVGDFGLAPGDADFNARARAILAALARPKQGEQ